MFAHLARAGLPVDEGEACECCGLFEASLKLYRAGDSPLQLSDLNEEFLEA